MESVRYESIDEVVEAYAKPMYGFALAQVQCVSDAEDVLQEVFLIYLRKNPRFESEQQRKVWLMKVTRNCCRGLWRFRRRHKTVPLEDVDAILLESDEERDLMYELQKLPEKYRDAMELFYFGGLSTEEIGKTLDCSPEAVRTRLKRGREMLKERLTEKTEKEERHG